MTCSLPKYHRRSIRLADFDYSQGGAYFVTICTHGRQCLFRNIVDSEMRLNEVGEIVQDVWLRTEEIRHEILLDTFAVMPNHFHGVVFIGDDAESPARATRQSRRTHTWSKKTVTRITHWGFQIDPENPERRVD